MSYYAGLSYKGFTSLPVAGYFAIDLVGLHLPRLYYDCS
jgi:hypothetical protein